MVDQDNGSSQPIPDFGGHPLEEVPGLERQQVEALQQFGFSDAEQVAAIVAVPGVMDYLMTATGLSKEQADDLVLKLRDVVPMIASADTTEFALGALPPTPEIEELGAAAEQPQTAAGPLPSSVNHIALMPQPKQQSARGTCVSFALTAVHEFHLRTTENTVEDLSEQFLYHEAKLIDGHPAICGTWQVKAAQVLQDLGQCPESAWTYNGNLPCNNNGAEPDDARAAAAKRKLATVILPPKDVMRIKQTLAAGCVVGFSIPVYNSWFMSNETKRTGRITLRIGNEPVSAGHAMCLVGYQDDEKAPGGGFFILRNSWFGSWGAQCPYGSGYGTIPYGYIATDNWEAVTTPPPPAQVA
jgi:Papain family cysteine protease